MNKVRNYHHFHFGFTVIEILVAFGIIALISGVAILAFSRGARNVQHGSFTILASNQGAWILMWLRKDTSVSGLARVHLGAPDSKTWNDPNTTLTIFPPQGNQITYKLDPASTGKFSIVRTQAGKKQVFGEGLIESIKMVRNPKEFLSVEMVFSDPAKKAKNYEMKGNLFPPPVNPLFLFWKSAKKAK